MSVFLYCGGHHDSDCTAILVWSPRLKLLYCKYHQFMYTLPNKDFLPSFLPSCFIDARHGFNIYSILCPLDGVTCSGEQTCKSSCFYKFRKKHVVLSSICIYGTKCCVVQHEGTCSFSLMLILKKFQQQNILL